MSFYFPNVDPVYVYKRNVDAYISLQQSSKVVNGKVILKEIPDFQSTVVVKNASQVVLTGTTNATLLANQYRVDYSVGHIYFHTSLEGQNVTIDYKGTGYVSFPAERIWLETTGAQGEESLQDIVTRLKDTSVASLDSKVGSLEQLQTTNKTSVVTAVNENTTHLAETDTQITGLKAGAEEVSRDITTLKSTASKEQHPTTSNRWWSESVEQVVSVVEGEKLGVHLKPTVHRERIVFLGSSTTEGTGPSSRDKAYFSLLEQKLTGQGYEFYMRGIGSNNTTHAINRFYDDVTPLNPDFLIIQLTIGNEGIYTATDKQAIYDQFKRNTLKLIRMAQQQGITPIVCNQAPTRSFNETVYRFAKQMNAELEAMGIFCIDWMGNIDDLMGQPIMAGSADNLHYNDLGHTGLANAFPPSLFKRIGLQRSGYLQSPTGYINTGALVTDAPIDFIPEYPLTSFTAFSRFRVTEHVVSGILSFGELYRVALLSGGIIASYIPTRVDIGTVPLNTWQTLAVSFNYISKEVKVYLNGILVQTTTLAEFGIPRMTLAGRPNSGLPMRNADYKDALVYRSRLSDDQIKQLHNGIYRQTSLELFAPLHDKEVTAGANLINLAPTTSNLKVNANETALKSV